MELFNVNGFLKVRIRGVFLLIVSVALMLVSGASFATSSIANQVATFCAPAMTAPNVGSCNSCHIAGITRSVNDLTAMGLQSQAGNFSAFCPTALTPPSPTPPPVAPPVTPPTTPPVDPTLPTPPTTGMGMSGVPAVPPGVGMGTGGSISSSDDDDDGDDDDDDDSVIAPLLKALGF